METTRQEDSMNEREYLQNDIAAQAEDAYSREFDPSLVIVGGYGKPGDGFGLQVFYGTHYLGRLDRGQFIPDSTNWRRV
jgi:hypothetical protein